MVSTQQIIDHLREVIDPELGINIVDLSMVKEIQDNNGDITVTVALTVASCPMGHTISADVKRVLADLKDVKTVTVKNTTMSKEELSRLTAKMQGMRRSGNVPQEEGTQQGKGKVSVGIDALDKRGIRTIIAVASGKGGVGKSFVSAMLAVEFRRMGYEVAILDADVTGPSIPKILGINGVLRPGPDGTILPATSRTGIKVASMNLVLTNPEQATIWRGPIVNQVIRQLYGELDWRDVHVMLVDLPPGTSDAPLTVYQSIPCDGAVIVSTPQELAHMVVAKAVGMARTLKIPILGMIENMGYHVCDACGKRSEIFGPSRTAQIAASNGMPFLGSMPIDYRIALLADKGQLEDYENPQFAEIARNVRNSIIAPLQGSASPVAWAREKV